MALADKTIRTELMRRFLNALHRMAMAGYIEKVGKGPGTAWKSVGSYDRGDGRPSLSIARLE